jgi:hypothetical protein
MLAAWEETTSYFVNQIAKLPKIPPTTFLKVLKTSGWMKRSANPVRPDPFRWTPSARNLQGVGAHFNAL